MSYRAVIGIPYDPRISNAAFFQLIARLNELHFNTLLFDCRYNNEEHLNTLVKENMRLIDGLLLPGSPVDIPPEIYGEERNPKWNYAKDSFLMNYQAKMVLEAKKRGMPILGICQGSKVLNVIYGGKIDQDITSIEEPVKINHDIMPLKGDLAHYIKIRKGTHLHDILTGNNPESKKQELQMKVNSWHHTACKDVPESLVVNAYAPDGVIEGIEEKYPGHPNCLGIQFHPEYIDENKDPIEYQRQLKIFKAFKASCLAYHEKKHFNKTILNGFYLIRLQQTSTVIKNSPVVIEESELLDERKKINSQLK